VRIVEYDPSRRADVADLMERVWGGRPDESELAWFLERNPVRPASVLLAEEDGRVVGSVAMSFLRMSIGGEELEVGMPVRLATDPDYRGRGVFAELQAANEERSRDLGLRLLLIVPNAASSPILIGRLGWQKLPGLRVWARGRVLPARPRARRIERFPPQLPPAGSAGAGDRVLRDPGWLNWRFADSPTRYELLAGPGAGYAVARRRGRFGVVAAVEGSPVRDATAAAGGFVVVAAPPPWQRSRYARAGYLPTRRRFSMLGKSLHPDQPVPAHPHLELGDLDFL
jgi:predicted N-acetyltransferase YhbS